MKKVILLDDEIDSLHIIMFKGTNFLCNKLFQKMIKRSFTCPVRFDCEEIEA